MFNCLLCSSTVTASPPPTFTNPISNFIFTPSQSLRYPVMEAVFWVWVFFGFNLRFAVRIFKVGLTPENNQRQVWLHSQPHPEQHSNFTVSTKMKTDTARSSFRHKQARAGLCNKTKVFHSEQKLLKLILCVNTHVLIWEIPDHRTETQVLQLVIQLSWQNCRTVPLRGFTETNPTEPNSKNVKCSAVRFSLV